MRQRVLVLGASGFIGRRIVDALSRSNYVIVAASRNIRTSESSESVTPLRLDATDSAAVTQALEGADAAVNCVAGTADTILSSGKALLKAASYYKQPIKIVNLSSMAVYGEMPGTVCESMRLDAISDPYGRAKLAVEALFKCNEHTTTLRPGIVYGPESAWWSDRIARLLTFKRLGFLGDAGQGRCNLVYVDDVATAAVQALNTSNAGRVFNLSLPNPPTWNEYFASYAQALGATPIQSISPYRLKAELTVLGPLLKLTEIAARRFPGWNPQPPIRPWLTNLCRQNIVMEVTNAEQQLGMHWTPLSEGLRTTAEWFHSGGRIK